MYNIIHDKRVTREHNNDCRLTKSILVQRIHNTIKTIHKELITVIEYGSIDECHCQVEI